MFVQGCPWRCLYCHNPHLQPRDAAPAGPNWAELRDRLARRRARLDALVFSGGEPTFDPALPAAMREVRALGFRVGLHTAGMAPRRLRAVLSLVDWVGLDIKAPLTDAALHDRITGARGAARAVRASLLAGDALARLVDQLAAAGARHVVLRPCRPADAGASGGAPMAQPDSQHLAALRQRLPQLEWRGAS